MRNNVQSVYGDWNFNGMNVCAKSGTSQLGGGQKSNAMFAGFVEDEQYPLAFIVVVENGGYGQRHLRAGSEQGSRRLQVRPGRGIMSLGTSDEITFDRRAISSEVPLCVIHKKGEKTQKIL